MRNRFTRVCYAVSAAAVVTIGLAATGTASAAPHVRTDTSACGDLCLSIFSDTLGSGLTMNAFVPGDTGTGGKVGQKVNIHVAQNDRPNGDFIATDEGTVGDFCGDEGGDFWESNNFVCVNDSSDPIYSIAWAPNGNDSGLCAGVAVGGVAGESVTLRDCTLTPDQLWIPDESNSVPSTGIDCLDGPAFPPISPGDTSDGDCPLINGGDHTFVDPLVMTLNVGTSNPTNQLMLWRELKVGGSIRTKQLFSSFFGPVS